ncbi:hypothetical protein, partial [Acinetobacter rudis]
FALMVVWGYPCESKSSPAHYSKIPQLKRWGIFFIGKNIMKKYNKKIISQITLKISPQHVYVEGDD